MNNYIILLLKSIAAIGALNWGLVGLFDFDLVAFLFNGFPLIIKAIYIFVGTSGAILLFNILAQATNKTAINDQHYTDL